MYSDSGLPFHVKAAGFVTDICRISDTDCNGLGNCIFYMLFYMVQKKAEERLNKLIERSSILVIATHSRNLIEKCCTRVIWLEHGRIKMDDSPEVVCPRYFG